MPDAQTLSFLRSHIKDATTRSLLYCGVVGEGYYAKMVEKLQQRFRQVRVLHTMYCRTVADLPLTHVKTNRLCYNCLSPGHKTNDCRSNGRCRTCQSKHNTLVHQDQAPRSQNSSTVSANVSSVMPSTGLESGLMMTSQVMLTGPTGNKLVVRVLLDSGASSSLRQPIL